jgi:methylase of polypeptide subunit release factors
VVCEVWGDRWIEGEGEGGVYDVIVKQKKKESAANYYSSLPTSLSPSLSLCQAAGAKVCDLGCGRGCAALLIAQV